MRIISFVSFFLLTFSSLVHGECTPLSANLNAVSSEHSFQSGNKTQFRFDDFNDGVYTLYMTVKEGQSAASGHTRNGTVGNPIEVKGFTFTIQQTSDETTIWVNVCDKPSQ